MPLQNDDIDDFAIRAKSGEFGQFNNAISQTVKYTGPNDGQNPILTLSKDVSTWKTGDTIVVASTSWTPQGTRFLYFLNY